MFIIYVRSPIDDIWEYYDTWKANQPGILNNLIDLIFDHDGFCNEYNLLLELASNHSFSGIHVRIFWEECSYGIR